MIWQEKLHSDLLSIPYWTCIILAVSITMSRSTNSEDDLLLNDTMDNFCWNAVDCKKICIRLESLLPFLHKRSGCRTKRLQSTLSMSTCRPWHFLEVKGVPETALTDAERKFALNYLGTWLSVSTICSDLVFIELSHGATAQEGYTDHALSRDVG